MSRKNKKKRVRKSFIIIFILLIILAITPFISFNFKVYKGSISKSYLENLSTYKYNSCINSPYKQDSLDEDFQEIFNEYQNAGVAIFFKDIKNDYSYSLNESKIYYSASVVKLFDAIYLIEKARNNEIDLNNTITYTKDKVKPGSNKTSEHEFNTEISLLDLISYAISVSDNAAHYMLVNYINSNNLNAYFKDLNLNITNTKPFAYNYTAKMANASLERVYDILQVDDEYSKMLKEAMNNDYVNSLNFDDVKILHKYGSYAAYYHDIGIYDSDNPYLISILSLYGELPNDGFKEKVQTIHKKINEVYQKNYESKKSYCENQ